MDFFLEKIIQARKFPEKSLFSAWHHIIRYAAVSFWLADAFWRTMEVT